MADDTIKPPLVARMMKLTRQLAAQNAFQGQFTDEARAIEAQLPPAFDVLEAREVAANWRGGTMPFVGHLSCGSGAIEELALAAIKRGRELERAT